MNPFSLRVEKSSLRRGQGLLKHQQELDKGGLARAVSANQNRDWPKPKRDFPVEDPEVIEA